MRLLNIALGLVGASTQSLKVRSAGAHPWISHYSCVENILPQWIVPCPCLQADPDFHYSHLAGGIRDSVLKDPSCLGAENLSRTTGEPPSCPGAKSLFHLQASLRHAPCLLTFFSFSFIGQVKMMNCPGRSASTESIVHLVF